MFDCINHELPTLLVKTKCELLDQLELTLGDKRW